jgi:hypothetical protein
MLILSKRFALHLPFSSQGQPARGSCGDQLGVTEHASERLLAFLRRLYCSKIMHTDLIADDVRQLNQRQVCGCDRGAAARRDNTML